VRGLQGRVWFALGVEGFGAGEVGGKVPPARRFPSGSAGVRVRLELGLQVPPAGSYWVSTRQGSKVRLRWVSTRQGSKVRRFEGSAG